ncbi:MAG: cell envelope integrity protein CreD [Desulfatiglans sp.]|nr:cell envelope integrity protein CreD [Desulfatiglans sp.]
MTEIHDSIGKAANHISKSTTIKIMAIGVLILVLLIPALMIQNLIRERQARRDSVVTEINQKWGGRQTITGPFITVPFRVYYTDSTGTSQYNIRYLHILPETLAITGNITHEMRKRGIFKTVVYDGKLKLNGRFRRPSPEKLNIDFNNIEWEKALLSVGISDMRGIEEKIDIIYNEKPCKTSPGLKTADIAPAGVSTQIDLLAANDNGNFSFELNLKGSDQLYFIPVGETNTVTINSDWPSPSFDGAFLPDKRETNGKGFLATWKVLHLNRNYPQFWDGKQYDLAPSAFGVKLIITTDTYQKSERLAKYAVMFLLFTFGAFFLSEVINRQRIHPIQYILIGMAILIFYTLVLSLSEHINFNLAYIISALSVTLIISGYAKAIIPNKLFAATILGLLAVLYSYLFIILQLGDYALLMGSIGLLVIIAAVMFMTRRINWYGEEVVNKIKTEVSF